MRITTVMFSCLLACASTLVLAESNNEYFLDQFAPSEQEQAGWQEAQAVYRKFAATPEFVGGEITKQQLQVRADLEDACMITFKDCQTFLKLNRNKILHALPDNPMYWRRFWEILEVNVHTFSDSDDFPDYQPLIPATMYWFYRDLLLDGELDGDKALALQKGLNLWLTSHRNLIGHVMTIAMRGIALQQMNYAMAQASRNRDEEALAALIQANRPPTLSEISFGPTIWMEREPNIAALESLITEPAWLEGDWQALELNPPPDMDPAVLLRFSKDPTSFYLRDTDLLAKHYVPESIKPWDLYWSEGVDEINAADYEVEFLSALIGPAYAAYIATTRYSVFHAHVFDALADIYTGRASPGLPGRPAPTHWRWDWQEGPYPKVCLVNDSAHPSTKEGSKGPLEMCLEYYDEKAVEVLLH